MAKKAWLRKANKEIASKILRTVPIQEAFLFFTDIGRCSGELASSLADFCKKMKTVDVKSVDFHFRRRDFQKWIRGNIGDADLADEIDKIKKSIQGEELRNQICQTVERRLNELIFLAYFGKDIEIV